MEKIIKKPEITIQELILFVLENCKSNMGVKKLNKLAYLLEFSYIFEFEQALTDADFAAINMGPVINNYKDVLDQMKKKKQICINGQANNGVTDYLPLKRAKIEGPLNTFLQTVLRKYKELNPKQLEDLTHGLDSYNITVYENGGQMGAVIDKDLGLLDDSLSLENDDE